MPRLSATHRPRVYRADLPSEFRRQIVFADMALPVYIQPPFRIQPDLTVATRTVPSDDGETTIRRPVAEAYVDPTNGEIVPDSEIAAGVLVPSSTNPVDARYHFPRNYDELANLSGLGRAIRVQQFIPTRVAQEGCRVRETVQVRFDPDEFSDRRLRDLSRNMFDTLRHAMRTENVVALVTMCIDTHARYGLLHPDGRLEALLFDGEYASMPAPGQPAPPADDTQLIQTRMAIIANTSREIPRLSTELYMRSYTRLVDNQHNATITAPDVPLPAAPRSVRGITNALTAALRSSVPETAPASTPEVAVDPVPLPSAAEQMGRITDAIGQVAESFAANRETVDSLLQRLAYESPQPMTLSDMPSMTMTVSDDGSLTTTAVPMGEMHVTVGSDTVTSESSRELFGRYARTSTMGPSIDLPPMAMPAPVLRRVRRPSTQVRDPWASVEDDTLDVAFGPDDEDGEL